MRFWCVILLLSLCAGCGTPSPDMLGADRVSRQVAGHRLDLYRRGDRFQVIRFGWLPRPERAGMERQMLAFAMVATGCRLYSYGLRGDSGVIRGRLRCPAGSAYPFVSKAGQVALPKQSDGGALDSS